LVDSFESKDYYSANGTGLNRAYEVNDCKHITNSALEVLKIVFWNVTLFLLHVLVYNSSNYFTSNKANISKIESSCYQLL